MPLRSAEPSPDELPPASDEGRSRLLASLVLWLANVAVGVLLGIAWLGGPAAELPLRARLFLPLALVSSVVVWALVPAAWMAACHALVSSRLASGLLQGFAGAAFLVFLYADTIVFRLLGHHMNGAVWNVLSSPASSDAVRLGARVWVPIVVVTAALTVVELGVWSLFRSRAELRARAAPRAPGPLRSVPRLLWLVPCVVLVEKGVSAAAYFAHDDELKVASHSLPLFPRLHMAPRPGDVPDFQLEDVLLEYPRANVELDPSGRRPNFVLLVIDSWRRDMFDPELTPRLWRFGSGARVFEDHLSGGNATRFGIFCLLYGLHGAYWFPVLEANRPPALLSVLDRLGYERRVFSSASMSFPEFDRTAWVGLAPDELHDDYAAASAHERDLQMAHDFADWLAARGDTRAPFFSFLLVDSPHQPYSSDGGPHRPVAGRIDYVELAKTRDPQLVEGLLNRYKNAVMHADGVAGVVLDAVERTVGYEDTLVLVTGDHGEEFQECGFWGHTSNFAGPQTEVPFLLRGPGIAPGRETRPSSHLDVSATLLELLGADPSRRGDHSLGESLLALPSERERVVAGWSALGIVSGEGVTLLPLEGGEPEFYDHRWRRLRDSEERRAAHASGLARVRQECGAFLRTEER